MKNIYQLESKKFEKRYGPAIAQFLCDELEKSDRLNKKKEIQDKIDQFERNPVIYRVA